MGTQQWTPPTKAQLTAADEAVNVVVSSLKSDRGVHAETAIAAAARLAGTFLFRSFGLEMKDAEPGSVVLSDAANDHGPALVQTFGAALAKLGINPREIRFDAEILEQNKPQLTVVETQALLEPAVRRIAQKHQLTEQQAGHACALVAARLVQMCAGVLATRVGCALAAYGFVEGSKTMPHPLKGPEPPKKSWFRWGR